MSNWTQAKVVNKTLWTPQLLSLQFDADILPFKAGQFLRIGMDVDGERLGRPYSLVNAPADRPYEIYFNLVDDGHLTMHLRKLEVGDSFWVDRSALGFLVLDEIPDANQLWLMASGSGIGPFISIINSDEVWGRFDHIVLCHSVRYAADLSYKDVIDKVSRTHDGRLIYIPLVSREQDANTLNGRLPTNIENGELEQRAGYTLSAGNSHVMLCGNSGMIESVTAMLHKRGMHRHRRKDPGHISSERYF